MLIFADLGFLYCLTALAAMISLNHMAFLHATDRASKPCVGSAGVSRAHTPGAVRLGGASLLVPLRGGYPVVHNAEMGRQPSPSLKLSESVPQYRT